MMTVSCHICEGAGAITLPFDNNRTCPVCRGKGLVKADSSIFEDERKADIIKARYEGKAAGVILYAHWKEGEQYVGTCGMKLHDALGLVYDEMVIKMKEAGLHAD